VIRRFIAAFVSPSERRFLTRRFVVDRRGAFNLFARELLGEARGLAPKARNPPAEFAVMSDGGLRRVPRLTHPTTQMMPRGRRRSFGAAGWS
jgi:hypothetical protein